MHLKFSNKLLNVLLQNRLIIYFIFLVIVAGCSITTLPSDVAKSVSKIESGIDLENKNLNNKVSIKRDNYISHTKTGYFGNQVIIQGETDFLPPIFNNHIQIDKQFFGLRSLAITMTELTKIPTALDLTNIDTLNNDNCNEVRIVQQSGSLIDLLNLITARCDLGWSYREGKIILADSETKTWAIKNIPGDVQVQNQINNNTGMQYQGGAIGGGGSQANSNQTTTQNIAFNLQNSLWQNLQDSIKSILSKNGKLNISPSTSSLTVTDKPSVILRVDKYIKNQNDIMKRQVQIDIQVLNVDVNAADNYGINWNLVFKNSQGEFSINGAAVQSGGGGSGDGKVGGMINPIFVPSNTTQAFTFGAADGSGWNGSKLMINALSSITKTSLLTSTAVTTLSNQPVPLQFVDQRAYLASVKTTLTGGSPGGGGFAQTELNPGLLTTGFSLNVLPVIQADNKVFMQLSINISALKKIVQYTVNQSSLQLPETLQRNFMQKAVIRNGDTFVVTGFDADNQGINNVGVGGAYNWLFGGGVTANSTRTRMVILVTPRVIDL